MLLTPRKKKTLICWVIAIVVPLAVILPLVFCSSFGVSNSCLIPGLVFLAYIGMAFIIRGGAFDVFNFQFINFWYSFAPRSPRKYQDAYQYQELKEEQRKQNHLIWIPWVSVGTLLVLLAVLFAFIPL
jgi:flagellar basal body-associated protein FliL